MCLSETDFVQLGTWNSEFTKVFADDFEPADVIGVMVPLALVGPQLGTVGKLFIPPDLLHIIWFIDDEDVT